MLVMMLGFALAFHVLMRLDQEKTDVSAHACGGAAGAVVGSKWGLRESML